jgi:hypothetical protein
MITLAQAFEAALASPENRYVTVDGYHDMSDEQRHDVNWNFVDADCVMALPAIADWGVYYDEFDALATAYENQFA